jgi:K+-sensing histidine kinase KdpD
MRPVVYHAYHEARRRDAPFDVLWLRTDGPGRGATPVGDEAQEALERLVSTLGGTLLVRSARDLVGTAADVASERAVTHLVIGRPRRRTAFGRLAHQRLPLQLMRALPGVDLQIVALPAGPTRSGVDR